MTDMPTPDHVDVSSVLAGKIPVGTSVTVRGWVRSRRDSKAGLSFVHLHDGSCFDPVQVVAPASLPNYQTEIAKLTSGCAVSVRGTVSQSQGKGQAVELQAENVEVVGWVDDPEAYPIQPKQTSFEYLREVAHLRPRTNTLARSRASGTVSAWPCIATFTSTGSSGCTRRS
jgi:asparaginyl-tRNA synthetase